MEPSTSRDDSPRLQRAPPQGPPRLGQTVHTVVKPGYRHIFNYKILKLWDEQRTLSFIYFWPVVLNSLIISFFLLHVQTQEI